jgi:hypothetical protein
MSTPRSARTRCADAATLLTSALLLSSVAIYNGYPLVWPDTGGYLTPVNLTFRSIFYSLFVYPARLTGSLWTVVFVQSLLMGCLLRLALREVFAITSRVGFLVVIVLLCLVTSLPWYTGFLMSDIFTPIMVLGLFLLAFCAERLSRWERFYVIVLTLFASTAHFSQVPIAIGLLAVALAARFMLRNRAPDKVPNLLLPTGIVAAGAAAIVISNYLTIGLISFSPGGYAFQLARLVKDGPAVAYLRENCGTRNFRLCHYLDRMPMETWELLWTSKGPFQKIGRLEEREEGLEIISGTVKQYPWWTLKSAVKNTLRQIALIETGAGLISYADQPYPTRDVKMRYPADFAACQSSRQARGELSNLHNLNRLHVGVVIVSAFYCGLIAIVLAGDGEWLPIELMATIALALLFNGVVSGALAQPDSRYGSRLIWLVPLVAIASWRKALGLHQDRRA